MRPLALAGLFLSLLSTPSNPNNWSYYGGDAGSSKYTPLDQITPDNFDQLRIIWRWRPDPTAVGGSTWRGTPLAVDGVLYISTAANQIVALDAATGKQLWRFDPAVSQSGGSYNGRHRGLAYWRDGDKARILFGTNTFHLYALDAASGRPDTSFGNQGRVDLVRGLSRRVDRQRYGLLSPPIICRDVVVVGSSIYDWRNNDSPPRYMPPGDVQGYDVQSGKLLWTFRPVPGPGQYGVDTWEDQSWRHFGAVNAWSMLSADDELGYVYLPLSTPTHDFYGGERPGDNLFGESLVCLNAQTGQRVWHYQLTHHGLWDYDLPAAPVLVDITVDGRPIKAVAQVTKQGFCFVFDRVTGEPVWPIEERPVPASNVPGERAAPTQPFPTRPPPFERQGMGPDDLIDFTPELHREALEIIAPYVSGPLYTPPSVPGTIALPGTLGGADWVGAAAHLEQGLLLVPSHTLPHIFGLTPLNDPNAFSAYGSWVQQNLSGPRGLPLTKPPYGRLTAIDLNSGKNRWVVPMGRGPVDHPDLRHLDLPDLGWDTRTFVLATPSLVLTASEAPAQLSNRYGNYFVDREAQLRAYALADGRPIGQIDLPGNASASPISYWADERQFIAIPTSGDYQAAELLVLAQPRPGEILPNQPMARRDASHADFYHAAALLDSGDATGLSSLLSTAPQLATARGYQDPLYPFPFFRGATLLHHVAGNPLRAALPANILPLTRLLLDAGADPNALTQDSSAVIDLVISGVQPRWRGIQTDLLTLLIDGGADPNLQGGRSLWTALNNGQMEIARALIEAGSTVDLRLAAGLNMVPRLDSFFAADGTLTPQANSGYRPPHQADMTWTDQALVDEALHYASHGGHLKAAAALLKRGAAINAVIPGYWPWDRGSTALHKAVRGDNPDMVRLLLAQGADPTVRDANFNSSPLGWAQHFGLDELIEILTTAQP